jgi:hypothetical protein
VVAGETETLAPVKAPGFHVYVVAPVADRVVEFPEQMILEVLLAVTVGVVVTSKFNVLVPVHDPVAPVTV